MCLRFKIAALFHGSATPPLPVCSSKGPSPRISIYIGIFSIYFTLEISKLGEIKVLDLHVSKKRIGEDKLASTCGFGTHRIVER